MTELTPERRQELLLKLFLDMERCETEEAMEACIHCGKVWYTIHHKDGVCHVCCAAGQPSRTTILRMAEIKSRVIYLVTIAAVTFAVYLLIF